VKEKRFYFRLGFCELDSFVAAAVVISSGDFFSCFGEPKEIVIEGFIIIYYLFFSV